MSPQEEEGVWDQLVHQWETFKKKDAAFVRDMVRKGIPSHYRGILWQYLCDAQLPPSSPAPVPPSTASPSAAVLRSKYMEYLKSSSPCEKLIKRDIARTFPEIEFFRDDKGAGQVGLFNVMKAYSIHDSEVGYCQGSAFLVGLLLLQMPEEDAFAILVRMMQDYRLREMYKPTMAELGLCIYQLESIVQVCLPDSTRPPVSLLTSPSFLPSSLDARLATLDFPCDDNRNGCMCQRVCNVCVKLTHIHTHAYG